MFGVILADRDLLALLTTFSASFVETGETRKRSFGVMDWTVQLDASAQRLAAELMPSKGKD